MLFRNNKIVIVIFWFVFTFPPVMHSQPLMRDELPKEISLFIEKLKLNDVLGWDQSAAYQELVTGKERLYSISGQNEERKWFYLLLNENSRQVTQLNGVENIRYVACFLRPRYIAAIFDAKTALMLARDINKIVLINQGGGFLASDELLLALNAFPERWESGAGVSASDLRMHCISPEFKRDSSGGWLLVFTIFTPNGAVVKWIVSGLEGFVIDRISSQTILPERSFIYPYE